MILAWSLQLRRLINKATNTNLREIQEETHILHELDHPNIVKYFETFEDYNYVYIVTELCPKGDLFDMMKRKVEKDGCFNEFESAKIMQTLLKAINHWHSLGITHRDIKPENIMFGDDDILKLIDFGLSRQVQKGGVLHGAVGSIYYIAPEVFSKSYSNKCDIWSLGIILYTLLSGYLPFEGGTTKEVLDNIK